MTRSLLTAWLLAASAASACPAGYESQAALAQSARLIIGVKVETVTDAPPLPREEGRMAPRDGENPGEHAQARVQVTEAVRGNCPVKHFNLVGGPYATCAPGPHYIHFKQGETLYLLFDRIMPDDTKTVVLTWRCRVFHGTRAELDTLLQRVTVQRTHMVVRHRQLFPEAMLQAEAMLPAARTEADFKLPAATSYPVLACLRLLLCDPENFRPSEFRHEEEIQSLERPAIPPAASTFVTAEHTTPWQAQALDKALTTRAKSHPKETLEFHRQLLTACLIDETGIGADTARKIANDKSAAKPLDQVQESPLAFDLDLRSQERDKSLPRLMRTASLLLITADEADDRTVWRTFGFGFGNSPDLDAELFVPMVEKHPERFTESWGSISLLLAMPHPRVVPVVKKLMLESENDSRLSSFFTYFASLKDEATCLETLAKFEQLTTDNLADLTDPDQRQQSLDFTAYLVKGLTEAADKYHLKSEPIRQHLKNLSALYPKKVEEKPPTASEPPGGEKTPSKDEDPFAPSAE